VGVKEVVYVGVERFWLYMCVVDGCCLDVGWFCAVFDTGVVLVMFVVYGRVLLSDCDDLAVLVVFWGLFVMVVVVVVVVCEVCWYGIDWFDVVFAVFDDLVVCCGSGGVFVMLDEAGLVLVGMIDVEVRDVVVQWYCSWLHVLVGWPAEFGGGLRVDFLDDLWVDLVIEVLRDCLV